MVRKFIQNRVSSTQDIIDIKLECNGDIETNYTEFVATASDLLSRLFENYGTHLSPDERQKVASGVQQIFDPMLN